MNVRSLFFATAGTLTFSLASAQVDYVGEITIPDGHDVVVRQAVNPSSDGNDFLYLVTTTQIYQAIPPATGNAFAFYSGVTHFGGDGIILSTSTIAIAPAEKNSPGGDVLIMSGTLNRIFSYNLTTRYRLSTETVNSAGAAPRDAMAVQQATSRVLIAKTNQIFAGVRGDLTDGTSLLIDGTATGNNQFVKLTEMAFAGDAFGGLLFTLDWGAQQVKAFDIDDPDGNYFRYAFDLPTGLELNVKGHGMTINNYGHLFIADGRGGGMEFSLTGELLATFSPPADELYAANNGVGGYDASLDATFITYTEDGNIFVMDGEYGLHWYRDTAAYSVPEPATCAALAATAALGLAACRRRRF
ncbi:MAG: hypothetical protein K0R17_462 [Rariglobus sp.]|jgi:hypothetical protein|nr:hypothetical protein [Rariglobus sp.]